MSPLASFAAAVRLIRSLDDLLVDGLANLPAVLARLAGELLEMILGRRVPALILALAVLVLLVLHGLSGGA